MCSNVFDCNKKKSHYILNNFQKILIPKHSEQSKDSRIYIGRHIYKKHVPEEIEVAMRIAQVQWHRLQGMVVCDNTLPDTEIKFSREIINKTLHTVIEALQMCDCPLQRKRYIENTIKIVNSFSASVVRISQLQDDILLKVSISSINNVNGPIYQYFHLYLDIQYYLLMLDIVCGQSKENLKNRITKIMEDLIIISKKNYERHTNRHAFLCNCMRDLWLIIQLSIEKLITSNKLFWEIFNTLLENAEPKFTLWFLKYISKLETYDDHLVEEGNSSSRIKPNYTLLESKLKTILLADRPDTVIDCLKNIEPLLCNLWLKMARIEVYQIMWDYCSKRLNVSKKKAIQDVLEFNELIHTIHKSPQNCTEAFEIFLSMLLIHLHEHPTHWSKMKGRIYSQLGPNKLKDLNDIGITRVMLLFLSLTDIHFEELSKKITSFLEDLPFDKRFTSLVWNIYVVFMITNVKEGKDLKEIALPMLHMLQQVAWEKKFLNSHFLLKEFITNFEHIINFSKNMQLHQWLLLNTWLSKYMANCYISDLKVTLNVLLHTLNQVNNAHSWSYWQPAFKEYIYPSLRKLSNSSSAPNIIGQISGKLCLLIPEISSECFKFFTDGNIPPQLSCHFLNIVLENYPNNFILTPQQESLAIQSWVKISFLTLELDENLLSNILKLDSLPALLKAHLKNSKDPIYALIEYLGSDVQKHTQSVDIIKLCDALFGQTEIWLGQYLVEPENEVIVFRMYTYMSLAFFHCGILLYDCHKASSPLTKLVQTLLLPSTLLLGTKPLHAYVWNAVKKSWHIFFEAIVKLNDPEFPDMFLERTLRDMIAKYMHYFPTVDPPIVKCLEIESTATVILNKICNLYLTQQAREPDANILKVLNILANFIQSGKTISLTLMKQIANQVLYGLYEVIMYHSQRNIAANLVKIITCSTLFPQVTTDFNDSVVSITEKHLAFNTTNYFQLMHTLAEIVPTNIRNLLPDIKRQICKVERLRGIGFDQNLRLLFEKLEGSVKVPKQ